MSRTDFAELDRDALIALVLEQAAEIALLRAEIETLKRSGKRHAAPFSKGTRVKDPKKPGRKPGQGLFKRRVLPVGVQIPFARRMYDECLLAGREGWPVRGGCCLAAA